LERGQCFEEGRAMGDFYDSGYVGIQELLAFPESFARFEGVLKPGAPLHAESAGASGEAGTRLSLQEARRIEICGTRGESEVSHKDGYAVAERSDAGSAGAMFEGAPGTSQVVFEWWFLPMERGNRGVATAREVTPELVKQ